MPAMRAKRKSKSALYIVLPRRNLRRARTRSRAKRQGERKKSKPECLKCIVQPPQGGTPLRTPNIFQGTCTRARSRARHTFHSAFGLAAGVGAHNKVIINGQQSVFKFTNCRLGGWGAAAGLASSAIADTPSRAYITGYSSISSSAHCRRWLWLAGWLRSSLSLSLQTLAAVLVAQQLCSAMRSKLQYPEAAARHVRHLSYYTYLCMYDVCTPRVHIHVQVQAPPQTGSVCGVFTLARTHCRVGTAEQEKNARAWRLCRY